MGPTGPGLPRSLWGDVVLDQGSQERDEATASSAPPTPGAGFEVAIISINYHPEPTGISVYSTGTAEFLAGQGHAVTAFTAFPYYPAWSKRREDHGRLYHSERIEGVRVVRCYVYVPQRPTALRRIAHELSFVLSVALRYLFDRRFAVTVIVSPPLALGLVLGAIAKLKGSRTVLHVQDLQPDAAIDLGMLKPGRLTRLLFWLERSGYRLSDRISTISNAMRARIESKGQFADKTFLFKNWAGGTFVKPMSAPKSLKSEWGLLDKFVVLYSGNMGVKQGLDSLLVAAHQLQAHPDIALVLVGDGGEKPALEARARKLGLNNLHFEQPVAREQLGRLLAAADISVITQKSGIKDLVLPSKLGNILTSRRPLVVQAELDSELGRIVSDNECGLVIAPEDGEALARAILSLQAQPHLCSEMAQRGAEFAAQHLSEASILAGFAQHLTALLQFKSSAEAAGSRQSHP